jgi:hypothetical protein
LIFPTLRDIISSRRRGTPPHLPTAPQRAIGGEYSMSKKVNTIAGKVNAIDWITDNGGYPEVGQFEDKKSLQKFYKQLDTAVLEDWAGIEGLEYKPCEDSEPIHRMRVAMSILYLHFPKEPSKSKGKSKYSEYTTEYLVQLALDKGVPVEVTENDAIMRMRTIMALRAAGHLEAK